MEADIVPFPRNRWTHCNAEIDISPYWLLPFGLVTEEPWIRNWFNTLRKEADLSARKPKRARIQKVQCNTTLKRALRMPKEPWEQALPEELIGFFKAWKPDDHISVVALGFYLRSVEGVEMAPVLTYPSSGIPRLSFSPVGELDPRWFLLFTAPKEAEIG